MLLGLLCVPGLLVVLRLSFWNPPESANPGTEVTVLHSMHLADLPIAAEVVLGLIVPMIACISIIGEVGT